MLVTNREERESVAMAMVVWIIFKHNVIHDLINIKFYWYPYYYFETETIKHGLLMTYPLIISLSISAPLLFHSHQRACAPWVDHAKGAEIDNDGNVINEAIHDHRDCWKVWGVNVLKDRDSDLGNLSWWMWLPGMAIYCIISCQNTGQDLMRFEFQKIGS